MSEIVKILVVDDHQIFRTGLCMILNGINNFKVVGESPTGKHCLTHLKDLAPDVIFMDIELPDINGIELTRQVRKLNPEVKIIALTMFGEIEYFNKMLEAGANAFLLKNAENSELLEAIDHVINNKYFFAREFRNQIDTSKYDTQLVNKIQLSNREKEVLELICDGYSTGEIAEKLVLSAHTIEGHRRNIMQKTGARNTASLVKMALTYQLIEQK